VNAIDALVGNILTAADTRSAFTVAQVVAVGQGTSADADELVTVQWMGTRHRVMHLDSYLPRSRRRRAGGPHAAAHDPRPPPGA
jgi:hypothetical protein